ncbi:MAG: gliding motility-associated C-terminal domain-containing protein [Saprospiraceae bacterium]|nr:gliding motility-associated C-terminal domain-containing protein [Saprospiraceae bacterium]
MKRLLLVSMLLAQTGLLLAQLPSPCPSNSTPPADNCINACIYCNFNGISSSTSGYTGAFVPGFCGTIENEQWLGFIAGAGSATFTATPTNCQNGDGVQIALFDACDSDPIECNGGSNGGGGTPVSIFSNLNPGSNYFLLIDGYAGDQCSFTITVDPPEAVSAPPVGPVSPLQGPLQVCPGATVTFSVPEVSGAGGYIWTGPNGTLVNGQPVPETITAVDGGNTVEVTFGANGGQICVQAVNSCFAGATVCRNVTVAPIPPTQLPPAVVCNEDLPYELPWGTQVTSSGNYQNLYESYQGCDSLVRINVTVKPPIIKNLPPMVVCAGECVNICSEQYCDGGNYTHICDSYQGCDSVVLFTVTVLDPVAEILANGSITCSTPSLLLNSAPSQPGTTKIWKLMPSGIVVGTGNTLSVGQAGTYVLVASMSQGGVQCVKSDTIVINANNTPPTLTVNGGVIGCGASTTTLTANTNAGSPTFMWSNMANTPSITVGTPGPYSVTVTNPSNGCTATATTNVTGNTTPPTASASGGTLTCATTSLPLNVTTNATSALYSWSGPNSFSSTLANPSVNTAGTYTVTVTNQSNNCTSTASAVVNLNNTVPGANAIGGTIGCNNPVVTLNGSSPTSNSNFSWTGPNSFSASIANPTTTNAGTYTLTVQGPNGCTSTATTVVDGNVIPPNAVATVSDILTCSVTTVPLTGSSSTPGVTYSWSGPNSFSSNQQNPSVSAVGNYVLTVTGTNACTSTSTAVVNGDFAAPNASATGGVITCLSTSTTISGNSTTPGATYDWSGPGNFMSNAQNPTVNNVGTYTLTVIGTNGCTSTATADVSPDANVPNATADGGTLNCVVNSVTLNGNSTTPGTSLSWTGPNSFTSTLPNPTVADPGIYTLTVLNPNNGCTAQATANVDLDDLPPGATATGGTVTCATPSIALTGASSGATPTWNWTGPNSFSSNLQNPPVTDAGNYQLTVTGANGCTSTATTTVVADQTAPQATATVDDVLTCSITTTLVNASATSVSQPVSFAWSTGAQTPSTVIGTPGAYDVTATSANGCTNVATVTVQQDIAAPDATATGNTIDCNNPQVPIQGNSATAGVNYAWTGPNSFNSPLQNPDVLDEGAYTLTVTGPNGCTSTATAIVALDTELPVVNALVGAVLTCATPSVSIEATVTNGTSPIQTLSWAGPNSFSDSQEDISITEPGDYTLTAVSQNGCSATITVNATQDIATPVAAALGGELSCATTSIALDGSSTTLGVSYNWDGPNGFVSNLEDPTIDLDGQYFLTVTGPNGCTSTASATVTSNTIPPGATADATNNLDCDDLNSSLQGTTTASNALFAWTGPNGFTSDQPNISISEPGIYDLLVTGPNGCTSTDNVTVTQDINPPGATALGGTIDCFSGEATLQGNSPALGVSWLWNGPNGLVLAEQNPQVSTPGQYFLTVTGANACTSTATATINQNTDAPVVDLTGGGTLTCTQTSLTLNGDIQTAGATGLWSGPNGFTSDQNSVTVSVPGEYTFTVTALNGCKSAPIINVFEDVAAPEEVLATGGLLNCTFTNVTLNSSSITPNVTYSWTGPGGFVSNDQNPAVTNPGTYVVTATNPVNGCTSFASAVVTQDPTVPDISVTTETIDCLTPSVVLDAVTTTPNVDFVWTGPNGFTSTVQSPTVSVSGNYSVVATAQSGCTSTFDIEVPENTNAPGVTAQGVILTCTEPTNTITSSSPTSGVTYSWTGPGGFVSSQQNPSVNQVGTYTIVTTNPINGCTSSATVEVEPDASIPQVSATGATITCAITSVQIQASSNNPDVTYTWSGPGNFSSNVPNPTVTIPGNYTIVVQAPNGCTSTTGTTVIGDTNPPVLSLGNPDELDCNTSEVSVNVSVQAPGNYQYAWSTQTGNIISGVNQPVALVSAAALYDVVVTNLQNGCTATDNVQVLTDPSTPSGAAIQELGIRCFGETNGSFSIDSIQGGTPPFMYSFDGGPFIATAAYGGLPPGNYPLVVQDANGCEFSTTVSIADAEQLIVNLGPDTTIHLGQPLTITVDESVVNQTVDTLVVNPAEVLTLYCDTCSNPYPTYTFRYRVQAETARGCRASDERVIIVNKERYVYIPTAFDPDSGNDNDVFTVFGGEDVVKIKSFQVFDRWGALVHEYFDFTPDQSRVAGWNGTVRGEKATPAVFVYYAEVEFKDGETVLYKGDVTLIRK